MTDSIESKIESLFSDSELTGFKSLMDYLEAFKKIDGYIKEKQNLLSEIEKNVIIEQNRYLSEYEKILDISSQIQILNKNENFSSLTPKQIDQDEKKLLVYSKLTEIFKSKIEIIQNQGDLNPEKYFTMNYFYNNKTKLTIIIEHETLKIMKITNAKGHVLEKENIDWNLFDLSIPGLTDKILLEVFLQYN